jgi:FdrA protein
MIDNDLRIRRMKQEAADEEVDLILFDVVLGEGSHSDPAGELAPVIEEIRVQRPELEFVAIVIGSDDDPQGLTAQTDRLMDAHVKVVHSVSNAVEYLSLKFATSYENSSAAISLEQFNAPLAAINVGLESFYESLLSQGAQAIHVEWRPPAGGNEKLAGLLAKMKSKKEN